MRLVDRTDAGRRLAEVLSSRAELREAVVLALPRGGVPVAREIAHALHVPFDVLIVRKLGHPRHPEYGIGALAEDGEAWIDPAALGAEQIPPDRLRALIEEERAEARRREAAYRHGRALPAMMDETVILADDGLATGVTAATAARYVRDRGARHVLLAVPVAAAQSAARLRAENVEVVSLVEAQEFGAVGNFYVDFAQLEDADVLADLT